MTLKIGDRKIKGYCYMGNLRDCWYELMRTSFDKESIEKCLEVAYERGKKLMMEALVWDLHELGLYTKEIQEVFEKHDPVEVTNES